MSNSIHRRKISFYLRRLVNFLKLFITNVKAVVGFIIIIFFTIIAFAAPLITPYTPLGEDPNRVLPLAAPRAAPVWLRTLPTYLGGNPHLSVTFSPFKKPAEPKLVEEGGELECISNATQVEVRHVKDVNFRYSKEGSGSLLIHYEVKEKESRKITVTVYKEFEYPYSGAPGRFIGSIMILVNGTTDPNGTLKIPVKIFEYLQAENGSKIKLYPPPGYIYDVFLQKWSKQPYPIGFTAIPNSTELIIDKPLAGRKAYNGWIVPVVFSDGNIQSSQIDSSGTLIRNIVQYEYEKPPYKIVEFYFRKTPGKYRIGVEITFIQNSNATIGDSVNLYIDEFDFIMLGTCFGLMGTNHLGQDLFSQLIYGTRVSLYVGILSAALSVGIGLIVGLFAGFLGGAFDEALMRINDFMLVIPGLPLLMVLVTILGTSVEVLILLLGLLGWNGFARLVRSQVLSLKERPFIEATRAVGASNTYIIFRHLIPNVMPLVYVSLATSVPGAITAEAALSWLGFFDPRRMSWGRMLHDFQAQGRYTLWWWAVFPGLCIALLAVSFILLGYALDEILNPKLRVRR